ncbi:MAG: FAD synthetase family protein [Bacillota bacterium]|nr:FAD synthetase family protein [Bacillota bacterium]MDP4154618.1 FAD synthetase family protein [Bacillota bacterium]
METIYLNRDNLGIWQEKAMPKVMALGCFDGIHTGHWKVINTAYEKAKEQNVQLAVMSFFPHPKSVVGSGKKQVHYLMPLSEKEKRLESLGVDIFYIVEFNKEFAALQPEEFVAKYLVELGVVHAVAGFDFCYGYKGEGNLDRLYQDSGKLIEVTKVEKVGYKGEKISSTCIRERLLAGNVEELPHFLGHFYEIKCDFDGRSFKPYPYYTLPAPGHYEVTLENEACSINTEVIILESSGGPILVCTKEIPPFMKRKLTIVWQRLIKKEIVSSTDEKILIS